jgi:hypothetical protein
MEKGKEVIISLVRSYMFNDWLLALGGASSHVINMINSLPIKISKTYVIDPSNELHNKLRRKRSPPPRL